MIEYESGGIHYVLKIFQYQGSVFPQALLVAVPCATLAALLRYFINTGDLTALASSDSILKETQAWSGFSFLVGFLIVFRTSQAYNRFWDGCTATHQMRAEWFDAASALVSFCRAAKASETEVMRFKHTLIRLFSMLHATALAELEEVNQTGINTDEIKAYSFELFDACGIDEESLLAIKESHCKVELIFSWIQMLIVQNIDTGVLAIAAPILSRAFQEIANGMVAFHDSLKITYIPFPFPYAQTCDCLLLLHWLVVPFVTSQWVYYPAWAAIFVFIQVFILWSLNFIAVEIENPFGTDSNDLNGEYMQQEMNRNLAMLLQPATVRIPTLEAGREEYAPANSDVDTQISLGDGVQWSAANKDCFLEVWGQLEAARGLEHSGAASSSKRTNRFQNCTVEKARQKSVGPSISVSSRSTDGRPSENDGGDGSPSSRTFQIGNRDSAINPTAPRSSGSMRTIGRMSQLQVAIAPVVSEELEISGEWEAVQGQGRGDGSWFTHQTRFRENDCDNDSESRLEIGDEPPLRPALPQSPGRHVAGHRAKTPRIADLEEIIPELEYGSVDSWGRDQPSPAHVHSASQLSLEESVRQSQLEQGRFQEDEGGNWQAEIAAI